jgi:hypothetical protein
MWFELALTAGAIAALWTIVAKAMRSHPSMMERIASRLEGGAVRGLDIAIGRYDGRPCRVEVTWSDGVAQARIAVSVDHGRPLVVRRATVAEQIGRAIGVDQEDAGAIASQDLARARTDFARQQRPLVSGLRELFDDLHAETLEAKDGLLRAELRLPEVPSDALVERLIAALDPLSRVAHAYERHPIVVRVLGAERFAWTGGEGHRPRCPYCHSEVTGQEADLVACSGCGTVHHEGCFTEHGRCTVLGCDSSKADRGAREKA